MRFKTFLGLIQKRPIFKQLKNDSMLDPFDLYPDLKFKSDDELRAERFNVINKLMTRFPNTWESKSKDHPKIKQINELINQRLNK